MNLPAFAVRHKAIVLAVSAVAAVWGGVAFLTLPRREDPEFQVNRCTVVTRWPGATTENVENLVTDPLESAIDELDEIQIIDSLSTVGLSVIRVETIDGIDDFDDVWDKVRAKVDKARDELPQEAGEPFVNSEFGDTAAMLLALYQKVPDGEDSPRYTPRQLERFAEHFKDRLKLVPAVARVDLHGVQDEVIYLETDPGTWSRLGLTIDDLQRTLERRNIVAPGGTIETPQGRYSVVPSGEFNAVEELKRVLVGGSDGGAGRTGSGVYLEDLGIEVSRGYVDPQRMITRVSPEGAERSHSCVVISFTMKSGENIVDLGQTVRRTIAEVEQTLLPPDVHVAVVSDQPQIVDRKINDFLMNLVGAVLIVTVVAFLLVGWRPALVMAAAIPLIMIAAIGGMPIFGVQLEQVSLAALIISLGMLVDCIIEVADNVHRHLEEGYERTEATIKGTQQIAFPVLMSTLTTVFAFLPMLLLPGMQGEYIYSLPVVVSTTLIVSWLVAMTVTPLMAYRLMRRSAGAAPLPWLARTVRRLSRGKKEQSSKGGGRYHAVCRWCLRHKWLTIAAAVALFAAAVALPATGRVGMQFFPTADRSQFLVNVYLPEGAAIEQTDDLARRVESLVRKLSVDETGRRRLHNMVTYVGEGGPRFYLNLDPAQPQSSYAQLIVNTTSPAVVPDYVGDIRRAARDGLPDAGLAPIAGARVVPRMIDMGPPTDSPIGIRIYGHDPGRLHTVAGRLKDVLRSINGTVDVHDTWGESGYQAGIDIDEDKAHPAGVTNASIARTLNAYFSGHRLTTYREEDRRLPVLLRLPPARRRSVADINGVYVEGSRGKVPLEAVADIRADWMPMKIRRRNLERMMEVRCRVREGMLTDRVLQQALPGIRRVQAGLPLGYRLEIGGEHEKTLESRENIRDCFFISILLIVICLVVQFNSLGKPLVILLALPLAATGSLVGLYLTGKPLGFMANLGLLSLAGVVINDAIVLVAFIEHTVRETLQRGEGLAAAGEKSCSGLSVAAFRDCVARAGTMRLLPIWLTSLTTIGGLIPLALYGGPLFEPMAVVIIFGLALATFLTLFVVPAIYAVLIEHFGVQPVSAPEVTQ